MIQLPSDGSSQFISPGYKRVFQAASLLVLATAMVTFASISFVLFPRPISFALTSPTFLVEAIAIGGLALSIIAFRMLYAVNRVLPD